MAREVLTVGNISAAPGAKMAGFLEVSGTEARMPVTLVNGAEDGPTVGISGGIHGAEYPGIEAAIRFARELNPRAVRGAVIVIHIASLAAFHARSIYVSPLDGKNLNRQFPGNPEGTATEKMADTIFKGVIAQSDYYIDLHGGDMIEALVPFTIYSKTGNNQVDRVSAELAALFGIKYVVSSATQGGTYSAAARAGKPAILAEAGGVGILDEDSVQTHLGGLRNVLRHLGVLPGEAERFKDVRVLEKFPWVRSEHTGLFYSRVKVGDQVEEGQLVGEIKDYFGDPVARVLAPASGIVLFPVTSLATNPGDPLLAVGQV